MASNFFSDLAFSMFVHFPGFLRNLGARETFIGLVASVATLASVMLRPWVGQAMDQRGRLPIVRAAAVVRIGVALLFLTIGGLGPWVFVVRALYGVCTAIVFTGLFTYANDVIPADRRTQGIALYGLSGMVPSMFGAALGDVVIGRFGFPGLFVAMVVVDTVGLLTIRTLKPLPKAGTFAQRIGFRRLLVVPGLRPVWLLTLSFGLVFAALQTFMRTYVDTTGLGTVGLFFFCYSTTAVVLRITLSWAPDRFGFTRVLYPVVLVQTSGLFFLASAKSLTPFVIGAMLTGAGHAFLFPVLARLAVDRSPAEDRGSATGLYTSMFDIAILVGGPLLGITIERSGYGAMYGTVGVAMILATGGFALLERSGRTKVGHPVPAP